MQSAVVGIYRSDDSRWNIVYERIVIPIRKRKLASRNASKTLHGIVKLQQDIRRATTALDAIIRSLAVCAEGEILTHVRTIMETLRSQKRVPLIQPFHALITQLMRVMHMDLEHELELHMMIAEIGHWIVSHWYNATKIWRNVYIPQMVDCIVVGLQCEVCSVVERWLDVTLLLVKICCDSEDDMMLYMQPLINEAVYIGVMHSELEPMVRSFIDSIPAEDDGALVFTLISGCLNSSREAVRAYAVQWLDAQLEDQYQEKLLPGDPVAFSTGILSAVACTTGQCFNDILLLLSKVADRAKNHGESPESAVIDLFLGLAVAPNANQLATSTLTHLAEFHGPSVVAAMSKSVPNQALSDVLQIHQTVFESALPHSLVNEVFSNLLKGLTLRPMLTTDHESISEMIRCTAEKFPDALHAPVTQFLSSDDPAEIKDAVLHFIALQTFYGHSSFAREHFSSILGNASQLGQMVFLWECTSLLRVHLQADDGVEAPQVQALVTVWTSEVENLLAADVFSHSERPVIVMLCNLLFELWRGTPATAKRPAWVRAVLKWGDTIVTEDQSSGSDHQLWEKFDTVYQTIDDMLSEKQTDTEASNASSDIVMTNLCPWGSTVLMLDDKFEVVNVLKSSSKQHFSAAVTSYFHSRQPCPHDDLHAVIILLVERLSPLMTESELGTLASLSWYALSYDDSRVVKAASMMMMMQAQLFPSRVRELVCTDLYSVQYASRNAGLQRFQNLWAQRKDLSMVYTVMYDAMQKSDNMPEHVIGVAWLDEPDPADMGSTLPPILGIASSPIIDLCLDDSAEISLRARKILSVCLREDPELFLRVTFEQVGYVADMAKAQMLARVRRISQHLFLTPSFYTRLVFNFIVQMIVDRKQRGTSVAFPFDALRTIPVLTGLVPHMYGLRVKDIRAKARAPFLLQLFDLDLLPEMGKEMQPMSTEQRKSLIADEYVSDFKNASKRIWTVFPTSERPHKHAGLREVHVLMNEYVHQAKIMMLMRIIEEFPDQVADIKTKFMAEIQHYLQEMLHDCYRQRAEQAANTNKAIDFDVESIVQEIKYRMPVIIHGMLRQTSAATDHLWLTFSKAVMPYWNDCGFDNADNSVHVLILMIVNLNMILLKHQHHTYSVVEVCTLYCQLVLAHFRFFKEDGYRHFIAVLAKVYEMQHQHKEIRSIIEYSFGHFYRTHGQVFILQVLAALCPSVAGMALVVKSETVVSLISSVRTLQTNSKWNFISWSPKLGGEAHFTLEELVKVQVCLIIYSPTCPGTAIFFEMLDHIIPGLQHHSEWQMQEGKKFMSILSRLFESLDPKSYNIRFEKIPLRYKVCLLKLLQRLGKIDHQLYDKFYKVPHNGVKSMLVESFESGEADALHWVDDYCQNFLAEVDSSKYDIFGPMQNLFVQVMKVYNLCPLLGGWATVFHSLTIALKRHPDVCALMAKDMLDSLSGILWCHEKLQRSVTLSVIDLFGFVASSESTISIELPTPPDISTVGENPERSARNFLFQIIVPIAHCMSAYTSINIQRRWSWLIQFILVCLHEKYAVDEALLALQVVLLLGHRSLGSWSASITAAIAKLLGSENHTSGSFITSRLKTFLQFVLLLKPNVYLNLLTHIRRVFPVGTFITFGSDKLTLASVLNQPPRTTDEMWQWLDPILKTFLDTTACP